MGQIKFSSKRDGSKDYLFLLLTYPIFQTLSGKLTWSHYLELLSIEDNDKRSFYEKEIENANWSVRELKRQLFPNRVKILSVDKEIKRE